MDETTRPDPRRRPPGPPATEDTVLDPARAAGLPEGGPAVRSPELAPGDLCGRYRILERIAGGGMGTVYRARDQVLGRIVALKQLRRPPGQDATTWDARFLREARATAKLSHPGIVAVHDVGVADGVHFLTMDFVDGETYQAYLDRTRPRRRSAERTALPDLDREIGWLAEVARALHHAHERGLVHRDVKPANILVDRTGRCRVADFGLAKPLSLPGSGEDLETCAASITMSGQILGTPAYMSPEQVEGRGREATPATDVYALGVVLYETLTGRLPFESSEGARTGGADRGSLVALLGRILVEDPPPPRRSSPACPRDLETLALRCLEKDPERRPVTARELAEDLERWRAGEPILTRRVSAPRRWLRRALRRRSAVLAGTGLLLAAVAVPAALHFRRRSAEAEEKVRDVRATALFHEADKTLAVGLAVRRRAGETTELEAGVEAVIARARESLEIDPDRAEAHFVMGWALRLSGRLEEAIRSFDAAIASSGDGPLVRYERGVTRLELALREREEAYAQWWRTRGDEARAPGEEDLEAIRPALASLRARAREDLAIVVGSADESLARSATGHLALAEGRFEESRRAFEEAVAAGGEREPDLVARANAFLELWKIDRATFEELQEALEAGIAADRGLDALYRLRAGARANAAHAIGSHGERLDEALGLLDRAEEDASRAVALWPRLAEDLLERSHVLSNRAFLLVGRDPARAADSARRAATDAASALEAAPLSIAAASARARALATEGDARTLLGEDPTASYEGAIADYSRALERDPGFATGWFLRGNARAALGRWRARTVDPLPDFLAALEDYVRASALDPDLVAARRNGALTRELVARRLAAAGEDPTEHYRAAIAEFGAILSRHPDAARDRAGALASLAEWRAARGLDARDDFVDAIAAYSAALERDPDRAAIWNDRSTAWFGLAEWKAARDDPAEAEYRNAISDLDSALAKDPDHALAHANRARNRLRLGVALMQSARDPSTEFRRAIEDFTAALARDPRDPDLLLQRGALRQHFEEYPEALADLEAAHAIRPAPEVARRIEEVKRKLGGR